MPSVDYNSLLDRELRGDRGPVPGAYPGSGNQLGGSGGPVRTGGGYSATASAAVMPPPPGGPNNPRYNPGWGNPQQQPQFDITQPPSGFDQSKWNPEDERPQDRFYRNQQEEAWNNFAAQSGMLPHQIEAQRRFGPQWQDAQRDYARGNLGDSIGDFNQATGGAARGIGDAQDIKRGGDVGDLNQYGSQYASGIEAVNPYLGDIADTYSKRLQGGAPTVGGVDDPLLGRLNEQATGAQKTDLQLQQEQIAASELAKGGALSGEEVNNLVQQTRGAGEARGLADSNRTFASELMNLDSAQTQRQAQRMAQAQSVDAAGFGQTQGNRDFGLNTVGQNRNLSGQNQYADAATGAFDLQDRSQMGNALGQFTGAYTDPAMSSFNQYTQAPGYGANTVNNNWNQSQFGQMTDPFNIYGQDLGNTNANAANNSLIGQQNQSMAERAGWMDMLGQSLPTIFDSIKGLYDQGGGGGSATGSTPGAGQGVGPPETSPDRYGSDLGSWLPSLMGSIWNINRSPYGSG